MSAPRQLSAAAAVKTSRWAAKARWNAGHRTLDDRRLMMNRASQRLLLHNIDERADRNSTVRAVRWFVAERPK